MSQFVSAERIAAADAIAVPNRTVMNDGLMAAMLIDCIAAIPCGAGKRPSARITMVEKANKTPATRVLDGRNAALADGVQRVLGRQPRDFADYARDTAATGI